MRDPRRWADAPISERQRRRLFAGAAAIVLAAAVTLFATRPHHPAANPATGRPDATAPATLAAPAPTRPTGTTAAVRTAAQRFLAGYLPWLYGHGPAHAITESTTALRHRLAAHPPIVALAQRERRPRLLGLHVDPASDGRWLARARIGDGSGAGHPVDLTLGRVRGRWRVREAAGR